MMVSLFYRTKKMPEDLCNDFCVTESVKVNDFAAPSRGYIKNNCIILAQLIVLLHSLNILCTF